MAVTLLDVHNLDLNKSPDEFSVDEISALLWKIQMEVADCKKLKADNETLRAQVNLLKRKKTEELAKPLGKKVSFNDLMQMVLQIHLAEHSLVSIDRESNELHGLPPSTFQVNKSDVGNLAILCAKLIILLTTYLDRLGVNAQGRIELFTNLNSKEWYKNDRLSYR